MKNKCCLFERCSVYRRMAFPFWFLLWCKFLVPSLKNTVSVFYHFSCKPRDVRYYFSLICIILKRHYKIFQKENAILLYFERKSNYFLFHSISNHQVLRQQGPNKFTNGRNKISLKPLNGSLIIALVREWFWRKANSYMALTGHRTS